MHSLSITIADKPVTITADGRTPDNRPRYSYTVGTHTANDLSGPVGGPHVLSAGMASLLGFMSACAESVDHTHRTGGKVTTSICFPRACTIGCPPTTWRSRPRSWNTNTPNQTASLSLPGLLSWEPGFRH